jgi:hypothetical protein
MKKVLIGFAIVVGFGLSFFGIWYNKRGGRRRR